jgi:Bacterial PH domain
MRAECFPHMPAIDRLLAPSERVHLVTREHGAVLAPAFLRTSAGLLGLAGVAYAAARAHFLGPARPAVAAGSGVLAVGLLLLLLRRLLAWHARRLVVTDRRALLVAGGLSRRVEVMPLDAIEAIEVRRSAVGRVLRYGGLVVTTRRRRGLLFGLERLPDPDLVFGLVLGLDDQIPAMPRSAPSPPPAVALGAAPAAR